MNQKPIIALLYDFDKTLCTTDMEDYAFIPALGYTPALESLTDYSVLENRFALVIRLTEQATRRIKGQDPDFYPLLDPDGQLVWQWGTGTPDREVKLPYYYANVVETLFSGERLAANQPVLLDVQEGSSADLSQDYNMPSDTIWKAGHYYLVQGVYTENELLGPSYKLLSPAPYQVNGVSLSQVSTIDITQPDGTCAQLDGSTDIEAVGRTFQVTSHSLTAQATDRPADLLPFQQDELTLVQGDYYAAGSKGCLISQSLADSLGLGVGGSLPLSLAARENTLVPYSYWNSQGFDAQDTYTISGIFSANEEYDSMVYIPVREDVDMTVNHCSYTLGQLQIRNGQSQAYVERLQQLLPGFAGAAVLDADGLNAAAQLLAEGKPFPHPAGELVVTPHPGEMARLTGLSAAALATDREGIALRYAKAWNAVVVLKGARTVVASPDGRVCVNPTGNPGLSRGGSGDVLAGMTAALLACRLPAFEAASCAVYLHGAAADRAAALCGEYGMLPHDILPQLGRMFAENHR